MDRNQIMEYINTDNVGALSQILQQQPPQMSSREMSELLREIRKAYKRTNDFTFLFVGRYIWEHSNHRNSADQYVCNAIGWIFYDLCFKQNITIDQRLTICDFILSITQQQQYSPYERCIMKIIDVLNSEPKANNEKLLFYLNKLKPDLLSSIPSKNSEGRSIASDKEKWFAMQSKLRFKTESYETCILASKMFLDQFSHFHYNNDSWAKRRIALCNLKIGDIESAQEQLEDLVTYFDNAFIYIDLMEIALIRRNEDMAMGYGANAILSKAGELKHKLKVLIKLAELYEIQGKKEISYSHYILYQQVREREGWGRKKEIDDKMKLYEETRINVLDQRQLSKYWQLASLTIYSQSSGEVTKHMANGEAGFITCVDGSSVYYDNRKNKHLKKPLAIGTKINFYLRPSFDFKHQRKTIEAIGIKLVGG